MFKVNVNVRLCQFTPSQFTPSLALGSSESQGQQTLSQATGYNFQVRGDCLLAAHLLTVDLNAI